MNAAGGRRLVAEGLGTALLVATVIGSGIMAETLSAGSLGVALLANTVATGAILFVLITIFGPVSGAHFNPVVSAVFALRRELSAGEFLAFVAVQITGGVAGTLVAHAMFAEPLVQFSLRERSGPAQGCRKLWQPSRWCSPSSERCAPGPPRSRQASRW